MQQEYIERLEPTDLITKMMLRQSGSNLTVKLNTIFSDIYSGDELDFLVAAIDGVKEIAKTAPEGTKLTDLIGLWADKQLRVFN